MTWQMIRLEVIHLSFTIQNLPPGCILGSESSKFPGDFPKVSPGVQPYWQLVVPATRLRNPSAFPWFLKVGWMVFSFFHNGLMMPKLVQTGFEKHIVQ